MLENMDGYFPNEISHLGYHDQFSILVSNEVKLKKKSLLKSKIPNLTANFQMKLLYRGTRDGFKANKFHSLVDY